VSRTEEEVYARLGLAWVPPAMREDRGESKRRNKGGYPSSFGKMIMQRMTDEKMLAQRDRVRALDAGLTLLHGTELNIAPDGSVDWDAHSVSELGNMPYDVGTAQRGWLTPEDVINTWPLGGLRAFLRKGH
jgi:DNA polymerase (family 10)